MNQSSDPNRTGPYQPEAAEVAAEQPEQIGRYRVEKTLGKGGFGIVYLAHDERLQRLVAIKVPHRKLVSRPEDAEVYLTEARTVAHLDHPNIVPVYDVGSTEDCTCYVVSKYIDGTDLKSMLQQSRLALREAVELVATVAEALHYAHKQGLVHRDIKPGNLLLDQSGKPFVGDFGLALREQDVGKGPRYAGTPAYMSPEQARGEGHRVDGRSDIFSLGVVFYELLTGRRPFQADARAELLEQIRHREVRPPRQWEDMLPRELERICLKALSKRASERYTTAKDMAEDLRHFLAEASVAEQSPATGRAMHEAEVATPMPSPVPTPSDPQAVKIVPKGLRSFDATDADFFLELLPGPRDREGLPDSIRFWKTRIETTEADQTFAVGLIYGPSGCGKSSLVKAGLLPRLAQSVTVVYVEATAEETEARLLKGLRRQVPDLPGPLGLVEALAALRQGRYPEQGQKVVLVLDQFEQWLHARRNEENTELVQALRQCDGCRVQCIVMVRDDFWMAATWFMANVEINLVQGQNCAAVDLFDLLHARKVLGAFGRAYGRLPDNLGQCTKEQNAFLDRAVAGLAEEGKVISVRLALFADMVKGKQWTPATLNEVGGIEGVGVTFLEETFTASTAPPQHRLHQKAAQAVLKALLPEAGTEIKGHMRSQQELLAASGYACRPRDCDDLLRMLDGELRLITPTDPEGANAEAQPPQAAMGGRYYQLTHDYLVPSLRDWLTRKQKETRRGRAELRLISFSAEWNAFPADRYLPRWWEWANIRLFTRKRNWTPPQRKMMSKASRYHAVRAVVIGVVLAVATCTGLVVWERVVEQRNATRAAGLVQSLLNADTAQVPGIISQLAEYRTWADPLLRDENSQAQANPRHQLHTSLALLPVDASQVPYLITRLLDAEPHEVPVIRDALAPHKDGLLEKLWGVVASPEKGKEAQRLRAAAALAQYDPESQKWAQCSRLVVHDLVRENPVFLGQWSEAYRAVKNWCLGPLADIFRDHRPERAAERSLATNLLADYAADNLPVLAGLLLDADEQQFAVVYPRFKEQGEPGRVVLTGEIDKKLPPGSPDEAKEKLAKRQANAAVALLRLNQPEKVWLLLKHSPDPRVRSYLIHRLSPLGADAGAIVKRLDEEPDVSIRRALLLSLGEYDEKEFAPDDRQALLPKLQGIYRTDADPGLHAASEWLLRTWEQEAWLKQVNEEWARDKQQREKRLENIQRAVAQDKGQSPPQWYVNGQGHTMVVIPGPVEFLMGSPSTEEGRSPKETQHKRRISRTVALASKAVTVPEFRRFLRENKLEEWFEAGGQAAPLMKRFSPEENGPIILVDWYMAAAYCNWLSQQEGIPEAHWCYETNARELSQEKVSVGVSLVLPQHPVARAASTSFFLVDRQPQVTTLRKNYLGLRGYRLPTEAEWEYACRAGAVTSRYYGDTVELLAKYGWYHENSQERTWPVGLKKPNDLGFFDLHGNVFTCCQESFQNYQAPKSSDGVEDEDDFERIVSTIPRVVRGGSFLDPAVNVRAACRYGGVPTNRVSNVGLRPARTFR